MQDGDATAGGAGAGQRVPSREQMADVLRARAALELAEKGLYRCSYCKRIRQIPEGIIVTFGGNIIFAICPECAEYKPVVIRTGTDAHGSKGALVAPLNERDKPSDLLTAGSLAEVKSLIGPNVLAKYEELSLRRQGR